MYIYIYKYTTHPKNHTFVFGYTIKSEKNISYFQQKRFVLNDLVCVKENILFEAEVRTIYFI